MADILYNVKKVKITELDPKTGMPKASGLVKTIETGEEVELEPVISEGEEKVHRSGERILAIARENDLLYGYNLKFKDATFDVELAALIEGGKLIYDAVDSTKVIGYESPKLTDGATMKPFKMEIYVANYEGDSIKDYVEVTMNYCIGKAPKLSFKKEFFAPEFEVKARENTKAGLPIKKTSYVDVLPV